MYKVSLKRLEMSVAQLTQEGSRGPAPEFCGKRLGFWNGTLGGFGAGALRKR